MATSSSATASLAEAATSAAPFPSPIWRSAAAFGGADDPQATSHARSTTSQNRRGISEFLPRPPTGRFEKKSPPSCDEGPFIHSSPPLPLRERGSGGEAR